MQDSFYYCDEIVNVFIEKLHRTIGPKLAMHEANLARRVVDDPAPRQILGHILRAKYLPRNF